jgi:hypothetical protein
MDNTGIVLVLAYPNTVVMVAKEWYSPFLRFLGIGKKNYLKAGHAALVLIDKQKGDLEYHDFGRYITAEPNGRVRGANHDRELQFSMQATIEGGEITNLEDILIFLANIPKLTHGDGKLVASVCDAINYEKASTYISSLQAKGSFRYAAFIKEASNCARFVTMVLLHSLTDDSIKRKLKKSLRFTPSTVGNVVIADCKHRIYEVKGNQVSTFKSSVAQENITFFLDKLKSHVPSVIGSLQPKPVSGLSDTAQWLSGIACGAWYEFTVAAHLNSDEYRFRRISPHGTVDIDAVFFDESKKFNIGAAFTVVHDSNCAYCTIEQNGVVLNLKYLRDFS